jgi:hypothetical protein
MYEVGLGSIVLSVNPIYNPVNFWRSPQDKLKQFADKPYLYSFFVHISMLKVSGGGL